MDDETWSKKQRLWAPGIEVYSAFGDTRKVQFWISPTQLPLSRCSNRILLHVLFWKVDMILREMILVLLLRLIE